MIVHSIPLLSGPVFFEYTTISKLPQRKFLVNFLKKCGEYFNEFDKFKIYYQSSKYISSLNKNAEVFEKSYKDMIKPKMISVQGDTFQMGGTERDSEKPIHSVSVKDFYISKTEATQAQWEAVMGNNPSNFKGDNNPVEQVSWYDAVELCNKTA